MKNKSRINWTEFNNGEFMIELRGVLFFAEHASLGGFWINILCWSDFNEKNAGKFPWSEFPKYSITKRFARSVALPICFSSIDGVQLPLPQGKGFPAPNKYETIVKNIVRKKVRDKIAYIYKNKLTETYIASL